MVWIQASTLATFLGLAAAWDLSQRRIPNGLVATFAAAALALAATDDGAIGLCWAGGGFAVGLGLLLFPFALGFVGAGDAKFFGVVGGFLGPRLTLYAFLLGTALGALGAVLTLCRAPRRQRDQFTCTCHGPGGKDPRPAARGTTVPYAVPLGLGAIAAAALDLAALGLP